MTSLGTYVDTCPANSKGAEATSRPAPKSVIDYPVAKCKALRRKFDVNDDTLKANYLRCISASQRFRVFKKNACTAKLYSVLSPQYNFSKAVILVPEIILYSRRLDELEYLYWSTIIVGIWVQ